MSTRRRPAEVIGAAGPTRGKLATLEIGCLSCVLSFSPSRCTLHSQHGSPYVNTHAHKRLSRENAPTHTRACVSACATIFAHTRTQSYLLLFLLSRVSPAIFRISRLHSRQPAAIRGLSPRDDRHRVTGEFGEPTGRSTIPRRESHVSTATRVCSYTRI